LHFIKESWNVKGEGDPGKHASTFIGEVITSAKNHVMAIGGNALLSYRLQSQECGGRAYRNQTYTLYTVTGDVALVLHESTKLIGGGIGAGLSLSLPVASTEGFARTTSRDQPDTASIGRRPSAVSAAGSENNVEF
jgi:hypothetical protein